MENIPASMLSGKNLNNGWVVGEKITKQKGKTGGHFSVCYKIQNEDGQKAFLKVADFSSAFQADDPPRALQAMLESYNFERDLLEKCKRLKRIITAIEDGKIFIPGFGELGNVHYLIFELAKGDIREVMKEFDSYDLVWSLKALHHIATGVFQLQQNRIAHQDLKPSNILYSESKGFKIGDLGRAADQKIKSSNDRQEIAGDKSYAPIDLQYIDSGVKGFEKKLLTDIYLFGSLIFFLFTNISAVQALKAKLKDQSLNFNDFDKDLPYLQLAFEKSLNDFRESIRPVAKDLTEHIVEMVEQLCDPDPKKRGHPKLKSTLVPNYDMQKYISKLNLLSKKATLIIK